MSKQNEYNFSSMLSQMLVTEENRKNNLVKAILYQNREFNFGDENVSEEVFEFIDKIFYKIDKAFSSGFKSIIDYFGTTNVMISELIEYRTKTPSVVTLYKVWKNFNNLTKKVEFYKVSKKKMPVMMGLDMTLPEVTNILSSLSTYAKEAENKVIKFGDILQSTLDGEESKIIKNLDPTFLKYLQTTETKINKQLKIVTNTNILTDRKPLKELVGNWNELNDCISEVLKLGTIYNMEKLEAIYSANEENMTLLNALYSTMSSKKDTVDKEFIKMFINYIDAMAKYVTSLGFLYYLYYQTTDMLVAIIKTIEISKENPSAIDSLAYSIKKGYNVVMDSIKTLLQ